MESEHRIPSWGFKHRLLKGSTWNGKMFFYVPQGGNPRKLQDSEDPEERSKDKRVDRNTAYSLKESIENTHMDLSCPFPDYWGNCKLTTLDRQICPTCKVCKTSHSPLYLGSWGTETSMVNITQSGEEALLMIAGQGQAQSRTSPLPPPQRQLWADTQVWPRFRSIFHTQSMRKQPILRSSRRGTEGIIINQINTKMILVYLFKGKY